MNDAKLEILIQAQDRASQALQQVSKQVDNLERASAKASNRGLSRLNQSMTRLGDFLRTGFMVGAGLAGTALVGLGVAGIKSADQFEQTFLKYETILGTAEKAQQRVDELKRFSAKTPFELGDIQKADITLQGFGIRSEKLLTTIGNASAITGASFGDMGLIIGQLSQNKGLDNINQLVERGVISFKELKDAGITFAKDRSIENSVEETYSAVLGIMEDKFSGGMEKLSSTLTGRLSTMKDNVGLILGDFAQETGLIDWAKNTVSLVNDQLTKIDVKTTVDNMKARFQSFLDWWNSSQIKVILTDFAVLSGQGLERLIEVANRLSEKLKTAFQIIRENPIGVLQQGIEALQTSLKPVVDFFQPVVDKARELFNILNENEVIQQWVANAQELAVILGKMGLDSLPLVVGALGLLIANLITAGMYIFETLAPSFATLINRVLELANALAPIIQVVFPYLIAILTTVASIITGVLVVAFNIFLGIAIRVIEGVLKIFNGLLRVVSGIINTIVGLLTGDFDKAKQGVLQIFGGLKDGVIGILQTLTAPVRGAIDGITNMINSVDLFKTGVNIIGGLINGLWSQVWKVSGWISEVTSMITGGISKALQIRSPSRKLVAIGKNITAGLVKGMSDTIPEVALTTQRYSDTILQPFVGSQSLNNRPNINNNNSRKDVQVTIKMEGSNLRDENEVRDWARSVSRVLKQELV